MREIKFRAFILGAMYDVRAIDFDDEDGITITTSGGFYNIGHGTKDEHGHLMQYTGLKDKNGVEIYEGDIVLSDFFTWEGKCIVKFGEYDNEEQWDNARMGYGYYTEMLNGEPSSRRELDNDVLEVIGNIHVEVVE